MPKELLTPAIARGKIDECMTSKIACREIACIGLKKKDREKKELIDAVAATMMLQEYISKGLLT